MDNRANKKTAIGAKDELSPTELSMLTGLLHRAVVHGQASEVIRRYQESRAPKSTHVTQKHLVETCASSQGYGGSTKPAEPTGSMSDASKRLRDFVDFDDESVASWDQISISDVGPSVPAHPESEIAFKHVNKNIRIPYGLTLEVWSKTLCKMDRVKTWDSKGLSYRTLVELAGHDFEVRKYIQWIKQAYGSKGTGEVAKVTPAVDLALFLECIDWTPATSTKESSETFVREFA